MIIYSLGTAPNFLSKHGVGLNSCRLMLLVANRPTPTITVAFCIQSIGYIKLYNKLSSIGLLDFDFPKLPQYKLHRVCNTKVSHLIKRKIQQEFSKYSNKQDVRLWAS